MRKPAPVEAVPRVVPRRPLGGVPRFLTVAEGEWAGWERVLPGEVIAQPGQPAAVGRIYRRVGVEIVEEG